MLGICCSTNNLKGEKRKSQFIYKFKCTALSQCTEGKTLYIHLRFLKLCVLRYEFCVTDLCCHLSTTLVSGACGKQTPTHRWVSTDCVSCRVLSSFGLNSLGRSKPHYEHHQACHWAELLDVGGLFNRRNISPLSAWQVVELKLRLWMELKVKSCNLFGFSSRAAATVVSTSTPIDQKYTFSRLQCNTVNNI